MMKKQLQILSLILITSIFQCAPIDYNKEGVNTEHLFSFTEVSMEYNGKPFSIHIPMDSIFSVFGPHSRIVYGEGADKSYDDYLWDNIGLVVISTPERIAMRIEIHWDYLFPDISDYDEGDTKSIPKSFFKGKILLNGIPLDNTSDIAAFCKNEEMNKEIKRLTRLNKHERGFYECSYSMPLPSWHNYTYIFHELYLYNYEKFEVKSGLDVKPFFGYVMKLDNETKQIHSFGVNYQLYVKPGFQLF